VTNRIVATLDPVPFGHRQVRLNLRLEILVTIAPQEAVEQLHTDSAFRGAGIEDAADGRDQLRPPIALAEQLLLARGRQRVELGALIRIARPPLGFDKLLLLQPVERRL